MPLANLTLDAELPTNIESGSVLIKIKYYDSDQHKDRTIYISNSAIGVQVSSNYIGPNTLARINNMGLPTTGVANFNNEYFLVDEDILVDKTALNNLGSYTNVINNLYGHNINILIDQSIWSNQSWYSAVNLAVEIWNSTPGCNIKLNLISSSYQYTPNPRTDIVIKGDNGFIASGLAAVAEYPKGDGKPGSLIFVNSDYRDPNTNNLINSSQAAWRILHDIGHCLGLRNNNSQTSPGSVMNKSTLGSVTYPISQSIYDVTALNSLYPLNAISAVAPYISGLSTLPRFGQDNFSISYMSTENGVNYQWKVVGINGTNYNYDHYESSFGLAEMGFAAGSYQIQCTISGGKYSTPITVTKNIIVP